MTGAERIRRSDAHASYLARLRTEHREIRQRTITRVASADPYTYGMAPAEKRRVNAAALARLEGCEDDGLPLPEPVGASALTLIQPRPTCERCGQSFRLSGIGYAWHVKNRPDCKRAQS